MSEDSFVVMITDGQPAVPEYFHVNVALNKSNRAVLDRDRTIPAITAEQSRTELNSGTHVLDARTPDDFATAHLRGSVNVGFDGRFAETGGMVTEIGDRIVLITYPGEEQDTAMRLSRIGSDEAVGHFTVDHDGTFPAVLADLLRAAPRTTAEELRLLLDAGVVTLVDIRNPGEREFGFIPGSLPIPLAQLRSRVAELPTGTPIVVHCAGGWRSNVAASPLRSLGIE